MATNDFMKNNSAISYVFMAVILYILYKIIGSFGGLKEKLTFQNDLNQSLNNQNLSFSNSQYEIFADTIYNSVASYWYDPSSYGTDEESIKGVFIQMNNNSDVLKLITVWGNRDGYSLSDWLTSELGQDDKEYYVNKPLRNKGITYQF